MTAPESASIEEQTELLRVLGHPMRLAILNELTGGERSVGDIAERTGLGLSVLSQQLAILRKAALVTSRREAKQVFYAIDASRVRHAADTLHALAGSAAGQGFGQDMRPSETRLGAAMFARVERLIR